MIQHLFVRLSGMFRFVNAYQFYFREFVQTVQAAYIFTVRTCFATETLRVSTVLDRKLLLFQNHVTIDVCYRNFSCRNKI